MTPRGVPLERSVSGARYMWRTQAQCHLSVKTQIRSRFIFPFCTLGIPAKLYQTQGTTWEGPHLPAVTPMHQTPPCIQLRIQHLPTVTMIHQKLPHLLPWVGQQNLLSKYLPLRQFTIPVQSPKMSLMLMKRWQLDDVPSVQWNSMTK